MTKIPEHCIKCGKVKRMIDLSRAIMTKDGLVCGSCFEDGLTSPTGTPPESRYGRDLVPEPKPLAQYLDEYIRHEVETDGLKMEAAQIWIPDKELLEQALEAYQSTENVMIKIERVTE